MRSALVIAAAALVLLGSGCMKIHIDTVITADGSGTATIAYAMKREVADAVARIGKLDPRAAGGEQDMAAAGDLGRDRFATACEAAGVTLVGHDLVDDAGGVSLAVELAFDRVADLSRALGSLSSDAVARSGEEFRITRTENGEYLLTSVVVDAEAAGKKPARDPDEPPAPGFLVEFKILLDHVGELDIRRSITVPGEIVSSNAQEVEGRTSIWVLNAANMLEEQDTGLNPHIVFTADGLTLEPSPAK